MSKDPNPEIGSEKVLLALAPYGIHLSADQIAQVKEYVRLLLKWNRLTSLTTITNPSEIVGRHFGESMFVASQVPVEKGRLVDIGSGAGFPGLALKIMSPGIQVSLVESNKKKCAFLAEVARALELTQVEVLSERYEDIRPEKEFASFVTARAVGDFSGMLRWARSALLPRGHILLWVGGEDITKITNSKGWIWSPPARIPESQRRFILAGRYVGNA